MSVVWVHALLASLAFLSGVDGAKGKGQPNIVFVLADDYGWNDIGYHGSEIKTPTLDRLAEEGVRLESYYVQPICTPSRSVLMSGRYQIHTGLQHAIIWPYQANCLPLEIPTLADKLKQTGYSNHMVGKWHLGFYKDECTPLHRGFDSFYGYLGGGEDYYTHSECETLPGTKTQFCGLDLRNNTDVDTSQNGTYSTHLFTRKAQEIIVNHTKTSDKPLFLYMAYQAVHTPMEVPKAYTDQYQFIHNSNRRIYAGMTSAMDEGIANITNTLKATGLWDNTVFVFSTDNGGQVLGGGNNWPLRGWKWSLWEGGVRGVGFVRSSLLNKTGYANRKLIHISDWYPTLVRLAGGQLDDVPGLDGYDQWETISNDYPTPRDRLLHNIDIMWKKKGHRIYEDTFDNRIRAAIRIGDYKLVTGDPGTDTWVPVPPSDTQNYTELINKAPDPNKNMWLFNVVEDPEERLDLVDKFPGIARAMLRELEKYSQTALPARYPDPDPMSNPALHGGAWGPWDNNNELTIWRRAFNVVTSSAQYTMQQFHNAVQTIIIRVNVLFF